MRRFPPVRVLGLVARPAAAGDDAAVEKLAFGGSDDKVAAVNALVATGDEKALPLLQALADGAVQTAGRRVLIVTGDQGVDALTGEKISPLPDEREDVVVNNRLRREIDSALGVFKLVWSDTGTRIA